MFIGTDVKVSLDESYNKLSLIEKGEGKIRLLLNKDKGMYNISLKQLITYQNFVQLNLNTL